jgi:hypothetical protein
MLFPSDASVPHSFQPAARVEPLRISCFASGVWVMLAADVTILGTRSCVLKDF